MNRNLFKNANLKEIGQLRRYMSIIYDNADFYSKHFVNKTIIYTTKNKKIELTARRDNFMHLCGVTYIDGPRKFFNDALDQKIQIKKILIKKDGSTFQKLQIMNQFQEMLGPHLRLTGRSNFTYLKFDHSIRTNKSILALALLNNQNYMVPISLLNLKFIHPFPNGEKIIKIESRDLKTGKITILN